MQGVQATCPHSAAIISQQMRAHYLLLDPPSVRNYDTKTRKQETSFKISRINSL